MRAGLAAETALVALVVVVAGVVTGLQPPAYAAVNAPVSQAHDIRALQVR